MSRGLGRLQREIMDTLDAAKRGDGTNHEWGFGDRKIMSLGTSYHGGRPAYRGFDPDNGQTPYIVTMRGHKGLLPDEVYDLRCSRMYLSKLRPAKRLFQDYKGHESSTSSFAASFSRAVRGLVERGYLEPVEFVHDDDEDQPHRYAPRFRYTRFVERGEAAT